MMIWVISNMFYLQPYDAVGLGLIKGLVFGRFFWAQFSTYQNTSIYIACKMNRFHSPGVLGWCLHVFTSIIFYCHIFNMRGKGSQ